MQCNALQTIGLMPSDPVLKQLPCRQIVKSQYDRKPMLSCYTH